MNDILQYKDFAKIEPVNKGWSNDKKYYIETKAGEKLLLRVSDISEYDKKKAEYEAVKRLDGFTDILMSRPLDFGTCNDGKCVYMLSTGLRTIFYPQHLAYLTLLQRLLTVRMC